MMNKITMGLSVLFITCLTAFGQERGINKKNVPLTIQNFIQTHYPTVKRWKCYEEKENENVFIECKFKCNKQEYSIKFLMDSIVETEMTIHFYDIPTDLQKIMKTNLDEQFTHYKILKTQEVNHGINPLYEINIKTKSGNYFELL